ncbi:carbohydrate ABC transporter permease [Microlunatus sp. GCM10028923]|uniref:carbohydrate ABC transporter permease n=1 Tax=Microlunatus sp. GCM10028923 TaxID=3273400 RepID=UPI003620816F
MILATSVWRSIWTARYAYLLMLPGLVLIAMFSIYPLVMSWYYSAFDWDGFSAEKHFIGLGNFVEVAQDPYFWNSFGRTALFAGVATPIELVISLFFAVLLNDASLRFRTVYRTMIFIPVVTTTAIVSIVMSFVFSAFNGPVNQVLGGLGVIDRPIDFLGDPKLVLWTAIGIFVWKWCGQPMVYWLAGLQTIPTELYEAARVDGAPPRKIFRHLTLPLLKPFAFAIAIIVTLGNLQVFAFIQALTRGGPFYSSEVVELYIFRLAFGASESGSSAQRLGYASAAGVLFGLVLMIFGLLQLVAARQLRRDETTTAASSR